MYIIGICLTLGVMCMGEGLAIKSPFLLILAGLLLTTGVIVFII